MVEALNGMYVSAVSPLGHFTLKREKLRLLPLYCVGACSEPGDRSPPSPWASKPWRPSWLVTTGLLHG